MNQRDPRLSSSARSVKDILSRRLRSRSAGIPGVMVRLAARTAVGVARSAGGSTAHLGRDAVTGAIQAIEEVGGEAGSLVRDSITGVIEGTHQVVAVTAPAVRDMVTAAIYSSRKTGSDAVEIGREAVEGAIVGAVAVGIETQEAATSAVSGAMEAMAQAGTDTAEAVKATVSGVVSGALAVGSDVAATSESAVYALVAHGASERTLEETTALAEHAVDAALAEVAGNSELDVEVVAATATGVVAAAYEVSHSHGDQVRRSVLRRLSRPTVAPDLGSQVFVMRDLLVHELPRGRAAWRGRALYRAGRAILREGGIDLAASLAYFTVMSFFPLLALVALGVSLFADPAMVGAGLAALAVHYFPASADLLVVAIEQLFQGTLAMGLVALVGTIIGANGLFMATNRAVNRLFGAEGKGILSTTLSEVVLATAVVVLFSSSMIVTALFQVGVELHSELAGWLGGAATLLAWLLGTVSTLLPALITAMLFTLAYRRIPNVPVDWRDAAYGGLVAMLLFEIGKHLFFWLTGVMTQRSIVYGPVAAFVVLLMWAFISGLIFLYGAALTKAAGDLRPGHGRAEDSEPDYG